MKDNEFFLNFIVGILCLCAAVIKLFCGEIGFFLIDIIVALANLSFGFRWFKNVIKQ